ncbi:MAG: DUF1638 domain-containing protein [Alphaproteobacteria bacterium]|nr:DUF1638 domain-containing protein [Alphaproteobacteria bacterium]
MAPDALKRGPVKRRGGRDRTAQEGGETIGSRPPGPDDTLVLACGALANEVLAIFEANGLDGLCLHCLPAKLHNTPNLIPDAVRQAIHRWRPKVARIVVAYADCGTGGTLDRVCAEEGVERIPGPHCYQFFTGTADFEAIAEENPARFYLTDFLARHFDTLVWQGMGMDRHPELRDMYFGNYESVLYLAQTDDPELDAKARAAAERLGLAYERRRTGYGELTDFILQAAKQ